MKSKREKLTLEYYLLKFGIAFKPKKAEITWTTTPPGELDIKRYFVAQDPACFKTTRIINKGTQLKTMVLADPTLNGAQMYERPVLNTFWFLQQIYHKYPEAQIYIWTNNCQTNAFYLLKNANEFIRLYHLSAPLIKSEYEDFKKLQQLNNDEIVLLDQTNLYSYSNVIQIDFSLEVFNEDHDTNLILPTLALGSQYFTSEQLMHFDESMLTKIQAWHQEYNHPLHIRFSGFAENKILWFINELIKYPQLIIYFEDISLFEMELWYPYLSLIPQKQIIGLKRTSKEDSYAPHVDEMLLEFIKSLKHLKHLFFEMDYLPETSIKILNFSENNQLEYLYLSTKSIPVKNEGDLKEHLSRRTFPNQSEVNSFLYSLPRGIKNLHLPSGWTYSLQTLTTLMTTHFHQLGYLGTNMAYDINNIDYRRMSDHLRGPINIEADAKPIILPATIVSSHYEPLIKGVLSSTGEYTPFAMVGARDDELYPSSPDLKDIYEETFQLIQNNDLISLAQVMNYIEQFIIYYNSATRVQFEVSTHFNTQLILLILHCIGEINNLDLSIESSSRLDKMNDSLLQSIIEFNQSNTLIVTNLVYTNRETTKIKSVEDKIKELLSQLKPQNLYLFSSCDSQYIDAAVKRNVHKIHTNLIELFSQYHQYPDTVFVLDNVDVQFINQSKSMILNNINRKTEQSKSSNMLTLDSDTLEGAGHILLARNIFSIEDKNIEVAPNHYRIHTDSNLELNLLPWQYLEHKRLAELKPVYNGTFVFHPADNNWLQIPTLHVCDYLYSLEVTDNHPVEIAYCKNRSIHYIRPKMKEVSVLKIRYKVLSSFFLEQNNSLITNSNCLFEAKDLIPNFQQYFTILKTHIKFTVEGISGIESLKATLPDFKEINFIQLICAYFASFDSGELDLSDNETLEQSIFYQMKGACRHRALIAYDLFTALHVPVNLVLNDVHAFLELKIENRWNTVSLGGFGGQILLQNSPNDELEKKLNLEKFKEQMIMEKEELPHNKFLLPYVTVDLPLVHDFIPWLTNERKRGGKILLLVDSLEHVAYLQQLIEGEIKRTGDHFATFDPNLPSSLSLAQLIASPSGQTTSVPSALGQCLLNGKPNDMLFFIVEKKYNLTLLNPLLDHRRTLLNKKVPELCIFAVMEKNIPLTPEIISRYSRIYFANRTPAKTATLSSSIHETPDMETESTFVFGEESISYKNFAGTPALKGRQLIWRDGWLNQQLKSNSKEKKVITLVNPPDTDEFHHLMHILSVGYVMINGDRVDVPQNLSFEMIEAPYSFPPVYSIPENKDIAIDFVLNSVTYMSFIQGNYGGVNGALHQFPAVPLQESITLLVTSNFSDAQWYTLFQYAAESQIHLQLIMTDQVHVPQFKSDEDSMDESFDDASFKPHLPNSILWINYEDPTRAIRHIESEEPIPKFYISKNMTIGDLFGSLTLSDDESRIIHFTDTPFTLALKSGKKMIVYGNPDTQMREYFESVLCATPYLLVNGQRVFIKEPLYLCFTIDKEKLLIENYVESSPKNVPIVSPVCSKDQTLLNQHLSKHRITFIAGAPQSGKSFFLSLLTPQFHFHWGIPKINDWLATGGVLVIDKVQYATLDELSFIELVHHAEKELYWNKQFYPLTEHHKVLIINSANESNNLSFFGNKPIPIIEFKPYSDEELMDQILKPFCAALRSELVNEDNWPHIQELLHWVKENTASIGPSRLFAAMLYVEYLFQFKEQRQVLSGYDTKFLCDLISYMLCPGDDAYNESWRRASQEITKFILQFKLPQTVCDSLTPMQSLIALHLMFQLNLHQDAKKNPFLARAMVKGLILEGAPGIGKTHLTQTILHALNYREITVDSINHPVEKAYILAPTDNILLCKKALQLAQKHGYVVVFDELNTLSIEVVGRNERSLIAQLIAALEPQHTYQQSSNGFFMIASQNTAANFANRIQLPQELLALSLLFDPGVFQQIDWLYLARLYGATEPEVVAKEMTEAQNIYSKNPNLYYPPSTRGLIRYLTNPEEKKITKPNL